VELKILFVDDETDNLDAFVFNCEQFWETYTLTSPKDILNRLHPVTSYDAIIVDLVYDYPQDFRPDLNIDPRGGLSLLAWLQEKHPEIPVMVLSAYLTPELKRNLSEKYPSVLCKDKPLDFSRSEFRTMMKTFIEGYRAGKAAPK
jgi:CheY-like chemotaxis protein